MNKKYILMSMVTACALLTTSCSTMVNGNKVSANKVGYGAQAFPSTVVAAKNVTIETSSSAKNIGTGVGAVLGAGAGQMLGGGSGRIVSLLVSVCWVLLPAVILLTPPGIPWGSLSQ